MVDSRGISKSLDVNLGTVMKYPELLKFAPDYVKIKTMKLIASDLLMF